jgi:hypothetical protein
MTKKLHVSDILQNKAVSVHCLLQLAVTFQHCLGRCQAFNTITSNFVQTFDHDTRVNSLQEKGEQMNTQRLCTCCHFKSKSFLGT